MKDELIIVTMTKEQHLLLANLLRSAYLPHGTSYPQAIAYAQIANVFEKPIDINNDADLASLGLKKISIKKRDKK